MIFQRFLWFFAKLLPWPLYFFCNRTYSAAESAANISYNEAIPPISEPVCNQHAVPASMLRYGAYLFSYNGCAPAALFNALLSQNCYQPLPTLIQQLEASGCLAMHGKLGTNPYRLKRVLNQLPVGSTRFLRLCSLEKALLPGDAAIIFIWNDRHTLRKGAHFFTVCKQDTEYLVYNRLSACHASQTLDSIIGDGIYVLGYRIFSPAILQARL